MKLIVLLTLVLSSAFTQESTLPTEKFQEAIKYFEKDYRRLKANSVAGEAHPGFHRISENGSWKHGANELKAEVWTVTLKGKKEIESNTYARVTITEFHFASESLAKEANSIIKKYSEEKWKMKTMNNYFIHGSCIYLIETDAVMFEKDYNSITERLKKYLEI